MRQPKRPPRADMHAMHTLYVEMALQNSEPDAYIEINRVNERTSKRFDKSSVTWPGFRVGIRSCALLLLPARFDRLTTLLLPVVDQRK
ncbi:MAG: hypothetical protein CML23_08370 [Rhizobiaceae bacterium]|nr:hypothetical protein [Rhizobiaceae bacterium]